jgi:hypothetical protein
MKRYFAGPITTGYKISEQEALHNHAEEIL